MLLQHIIDGSNFIPDLSPWVLYPLTAVIGYLLGSLNWSIIFSQLIYKSDIRKYGSGNAGMTNTLRTYGKSKAALVFGLDMLKTVAAGLIGAALIGYDMGVKIGGLCAVLGHVFPLYYHFKGGKGVVCGITVVTLMDWRVACCVLGVFLVVLAIRRIISLASVCGALTFPVGTLIFHPGDWFSIGFALATGLFIVWLHRANIKRLIEGTEAPITAKKEKREKGAAR